MTGDFENLKQLINLEHTNNQLTNFCERILNKYGYKNPKKISFIYIIVWNLENIADDYKYICEYLDKNRKTKLSKELIKLFEKAHDYLKGYYEFSYKFSLEKANKLIMEKKNISEYSEKILNKLSQKEIPVYSYLIQNITNISYAIPSTIALNQ